jgi:hypothetical protein
LTGEQKQEVKRTARKLYQDGRISLEMAVWAMKNAGYTEKNGHSITLIFPEESRDFIRGYVAGQIDALRLTLEHIRDAAARLDGEKDLAS